MKDKNIDSDNNNNNNNIDENDYIYEDDDDDFYFSSKQSLNNRNLDKNEKEDGDINDYKYDNDDDNDNDEPLPILTSEDSTCSICLSPFENLTFLDICFHQFCFVCILQWSELNQKCPLCKSGFHSLIYQVKSNTDYQRFIINNKQTTNKNTNTTTTTTTTSNTNNNNNNNNNNNFNNINNIRYQRQHHQQVYLPNLSTTEKHNFRKSIYSKNIKAIPMVPPFKLYLDPRSITSNFKSFKTKVQPWIKRELQSLLQTSDTDILENLLFELLKKFNILHEPKVRETLERFLFEKTDLFIHELLCFATSPYNISTYDSKVIYDKKQPLITNNNNNQINGNENENRSKIENDKILEPLSNILQQTSSPIKHIPSFLSNILEEEIEKQQETVERILQIQKKRENQSKEEENIRKILRLKEPNWDHFNNNSTTADELETTISNLSGYIYNLKQFQNNNNKNGEDDS